MVRQSTIALSQTTPHPPHNFQHTPAEKPAGVAPAKPQGIKARYTFEFTLFANPTSQLPTARVELEPAKMEPGKKQGIKARYTFRLH